jgi:hypothetical protein
MTDAAETVGWIVATFAALGVALGLAGYVSVSWGYEVFVLAAQGQGGVAERFGPIFVSLVFFQNVSVAFFVGLVASLLAGLTFGSQFYDGRTAVLATGAGGLVGFYVMVVLAFLLMSMGMQTARGFGLGDALVPFLLAGVPSGIVGAVAGYFGWMRS